MDRQIVRTALVSGLAGTILAGVCYGVRVSAERGWQRETQLAAADARAAAARAYADRDVPVETIVANGATWSEMLQDMDIDPQTVFNITQAARKVFNLRSIRPGNKVVVTRSATGDLRTISYRMDSEHELIVKRDGQDFRGEIKENLGQVTLVSVSGTVDGSLFDSVIAAGEKPELAVRLAEIFAWDIDFNTETQAGDVFRLAVEKKEFSDGSPPAYGRILAAEYSNVGHPYQAVLFHDPQGRPVYYAADGKSLQKAFLRSPFRFGARVSSHFSTRRLHPILKIRRPHLGTDYAAPTGTPVQTIAEGHVVYAGWKGGGGNTVQIAHARGYATYYMHLSRILVRRGQRVHQGQRIGLVGMTGLATGPHLDFRIQQHGRFVNFERMNLPPANPVATSDWPEFEAERDKSLALLPATAVQNAHVVSLPRPGGL